MATDSLKTIDKTLVPIISLSVRAHGLVALGPLGMGPQQARPDLSDQMRSDTLSVRALGMGPRTLSFNFSARSDQIRSDAIRSDRMRSDTIPQRARCPLVMRWIAARAC